MGNFWSDVYASKSDLLQEFVHGETNCKDAIKISKDMIREIIEIVEETSNWERTADFKKYKLYPGQEIFYGNVLGRIHPAVYLYDGLIIEIGSGPRACQGTTSFTTSFFGMSSLKEFKRYGKRVRKSDTFKVNTGKDHQKNVMLARLRRAKKAIGPKPFRVFSHNCIHMTNQVVFNRKDFPENAEVEKIR